MLLLVHWLLLLRRVLLLRRILLLLARVCLLLLLLGVLLLRRILLLLLRVLLLLRRIALLACPITGVYRLALCRLSKILHCNHGARLSVVKRWGILLDSVLLRSTKLTKP